MNRPPPRDPEPLSAWVAYAAERLGETRRRRAEAPITAPLPAGKELQERLSRMTFRTPMPLDQVVEVCLELMTRWGVRTADPANFGWLEATPTAPSVAADLLASALNPQLAVWATSPGPVEVERHLVDLLGASFGLPESRGGSFTTGGSEANLTACLLALNRACPGHARHGFSGHGRRVLYASEEGHRSLDKAAASVGLGQDAVCRVRVDPDLRMDLGDLRTCIRRDKASGRHPLMAIGVAGSTSAGIIDPLEGLAEECATEGLWCHVDAAWGGALVFSSQEKHHLAGIERADSITFDPHKWLSVPLGTGMLLVRDRQGPGGTFRVDAPYVAEGSADPYLESLQWSRRFIGLRLLMTLLSESWDGISARIRTQMQLADGFRRQLADQGWTLLNRTPLPTVCFTDARGAGPERGDRYHAALVDAINGRGRVRLAGTWVRGVQALRVCICSRETTQADLDTLLAELHRARETLG